MSEYPKVSQEIIDPVSENLKQLASLFPAAVKDGQLDVEALKAELGEFEEVGEEKYQLNWPGKQAAKQKAFEKPAGRTLKFVPEESKNPETTENIFIEGDNLEALQLLRKNYYGAIKMIYIDPPYNTGNDFVYKDNFKMSQAESDQVEGNVSEDGERLIKNSKDSGRYHSNWLNMMYPRLKIARELLKEDGVIVIHIDENEYPNLEKLLTEIFGTENNLGTVVWDKRNPKGDATGIAQQHELICFYCKSRDVFKAKVDFRRPKENAEAMLRKVSQLIAADGDVYESVRLKYKQWLKKQDFSGGEKAYCLIDNNGEIYRPVSMAWPNKKKAPDNYFIPLIHPVTKKECVVPDRGWRNPPDTMSKLQQSGLVLFGKDETTQPNRKYLLKENLYENVSSLIYYGGSDDALLAELGVLFDTPKVVDVSRKLIIPVCNDNDIILDFFAGSATTAHAVMQLNAEDGGNRKSIMVQLPEACDEKSEAFKTGYKTIAEISKERIRRAGEKIKADNAGKEGIENLDVGFKVFKTGDTNINWLKADLRGDDLSAFANASDKDKLDFTPNATDLDVVYEIMLRQADVPLSASVEKLDEIGERTYLFADSYLVCLEQEITQDLINELAEIEPLPIKFVFRDSAFGDDIALKDKTFRTLSALIDRNTGDDKQTYTVEFI